MFYVGDKSVTVFTAKRVTLAVHDNDCGPCGGQLGLLRGDEISSEGSTDNCVFLLVRTGQIF